MRHARLEVLQMAQIHEVYKCNICGNIVNVLHGGKGQLICCGKPMTLLNEKTSADEGLESTFLLSKKAPCLLSK